MTPTNYGNENIFVDNYSIGGGKFPPTDVIKDNYQIWLRENALNLGLGVIGGSVQTTMGVIRTASGDYSGLTEVGSGLGQIFGIMKENYLHSRIPPTSTGIVNVGDLQLALKLNTFTFSQMCIKKEYAKIIDDFFSTFGYKVSEIKVPNITGRTNWNYVKTIDSIVEGINVPDKYLEEFKQMLNKGITFWHNPQTFLDYSQTNNIS